MNSQLHKLTEEVKAKLLEAMAVPEVKKLLSKIKDASDTDTGTFKMVISTSSVDRHGESVDQKGWQLENYQVNPIVLWSHDSWAMPIGVTDKIYVEGEKLIAEGRFAPAEVNPLAQQVRRAYELGIMNMASVGFIPHEQEGNTYTKCELLEWSFVPVPANPQCSRLEEKELGELISKGLIIDKMITKDTEVAEVLPAPVEPAALEDETQKKTVKADSTALSEAVGEEFAKMQSEIVDSMNLHTINVMKLIMAEEDGEPVDEKSKSLQKSGRVLSDKNRGIINTSIEQMEKSIAALRELLDATNSSSAEGEDDDKKNVAAPKQRSELSESGSATFKEWAEQQRILKAINIASADALRKFNAKRRATK